mgnify:CR=1 FL=1
MGLAKADVAEKKKRVVLFGDSAWAASGSMQTVSEMIP